MLLDDLFELLETVVVSDRVALKLRVILAIGLKLFRVLVPVYIKQPILRCHKLTFDLTRTLDILKEEDHYPRGFRRRAPVLCELSTFSRPPKF